MVSSRLLGKFQCEFCFRTTRDSYDLRKHRLNSLHPNSGPVIGFKSVIPQLHDALSQPLDNTKSSLMPLGKNQCEFCYKIMKDNYALTQHRRIHTGKAI
ncbi:hypothetical protein DPMN_069269 [Dreissena polymorpha]|uniref:C2H2-type domain-containing protein n=1 Tax=Dreissena polymorpha TaxID=45954 RepID=A0A9D4BUT2_DREPO|nr:hypothetical protein DPMN_069269 [Dreissena polymorpha]